MIMMMTMEIMMMMMMMTMKIMMMTTTMMMSSLMVVLHLAALITDHLQRMLALPMAFLIIAFNDHSTFSNLDF